MSSHALEQWIEAEGVQLRVVSEGEGPPVLVLHGFTGSAESMACVSEELRSNHSVHRVDLVGHGGSDSPASTAAFQMSACVDQLLVVMDRLGVNQAVLVGYSMGARAALSFAVSHPERVSELVLIGVSPGLASSEERESRKKSDEELADRVLNIGVEAFVDEWMAKPIFSSQKRLGETERARSRAERLNGSAHGWAQSLRGMGTGAMRPLHADLSSLMCPVLLVVGEEDEKFKALAQTMLESLPRGELALIEEAGHAAHLEQPKGFASSFHQFLQSHRRHSVLPETA
ncbi:MAG: 2-succinyl-6-hydroxy-2,4-cyclohexadiene-1-carboxylate synthase [Deltaproteobacteria bacterium]|nr:2-succinyl-6-hydroxy-2,4-cyclohexadiene-1-carboxylate synthase [Deltaproteobacteria bacterium]